MKEILSKLKEFFRENPLTIVYMIIPVLLFVIIAYNCGKAVKVKESAVSVVAERIEATSNELKSIEEKIELDKNIINEVNDYKANKEDKEAELSELDTTLENRKGEIADLDRQISEKNSELNTLKAIITKTGEEPKVLPAGQFTVGYDLPQGRYDVTGSSNFVVRTPSGNLKVNTILGGRYGNENYVCNLNIGDTLDLHSKCTFTPIK